MKKIKNKIMLITYPDSMGGNLKALQKALESYAPGAVESIHILPFFPSSGDRGFSPITYDVVDPTFGDWDDIAALANQYTLMCDMMVNHISRQSAEFRDYMKKGQASSYAEMFFDYEKFFGGEPSAEELAKIYKRSDKPLYQQVTLPDGTVKKLWCSFSAEQIDVDTNSPITREYIMRNLHRLGERGISVVRMDAYGYITKVKNSNCFFVEPQVWELIGEMEALLAKQNMTLLPEVHDRYETALKIAEHGYYTYDFVLPLLVLHTLFSGSGKELKHWFSIAPENQFTVLDTHDGIGVFDADGIVTSQQAEEVIRRAEPNLSYSFKPMDMSKKKYYKAYQLYGTYYAILGEDDQAYLLARAIQFFAPGIPQVYYVGMLAGKNDLDFDPRDHRFINRHDYTMEEIAEQVQRPVVQKLLEMMRLRNRHPAFQGELTVADTPDHVLHFKRSMGMETVVLEADLKTKAFTIRYSENGQMRSL